MASSSSSASRRAKRKRQGDEVTKAVSSTRKKPHLEMPGRETAQPPRTPKARATTGISDAPFELFEELAHVPARVIQPETVYSIFARRSDKKYQDQLPMLIRLFFAIASPDVIDQLSEAGTIRSPYRKMAQKFRSQCQMEMQQNRSGSICGLK